MINGRTASMAPIMTAMQSGGYTRENICHQNSFATPTFCKHQRILAGLETRQNHADLSGGGVPQISQDLVSDAMQDINVHDKVYWPQPTGKIAANVIDQVVSLCHEGILSGAQPDAHNTIDPSSSTWDWLTTAHGELSLASIPTLQPNITAPVRAAIVPRTFRAALSCGQLMSLTMMQAAHDKINHTLLKWSKIIGSCHRWVDCERHETTYTNTCINVHQRSTLQSALLYFN